MTLFEFALKNISRDRRNYVYYFISCAFSVFVFFLFSVLSFHPALKIVDINSMMGMILALGEVISVVFSICFISYSMRCFLKARSRQLGLITLLGASKRQMNRLLFMENILVAILSILTGILFGLVFSKLFLDAANQMIGVSEFTFYWPVKAMSLTVLVMGMVFGCIAYFIPRLIRKNEIAKLFKADLKDDRPQKLLPMLAAFVVSTPVLLWILIGQSDIPRMIRENFFFPFLLAVFGVLGTYLFFSYAMRLWIAYQMKSRCNISLISVGNQRARIRTNVQSMTISSILYAVSFFAVIILFSMSLNVKSETEKILPYALTYNTWTKEADAKRDIAFIEQELQGLAGYQKTEVELWYPDADSRNPFMSQSSYNQVMHFLNKEPVSITETGIYLVAGSSDHPLNEIPDSAKDLLLHNGLSLSVEGLSDDIITLTGFTNGICVVNDAVFHNLMPLLTEEIITAFSYDGWETNSKNPEHIIETLQDTLQKRDASVVYAYSYYRSSQLQNNLALYIGGMLSFVFILAVASFIYSRLYSDLDAECKRYAGIVKIGLSQKELSLVLYRFTFLILYVPFCTALVYLWIGVLIIEHFTLISNIPVALWFTVILLVLQTLLYMWINTSYRRTVFRKVYGI